MVESRPPANPLFLRDEELRQGIELMFYAYRDFTFESDQQLKRYQLGRAHHRALYFIGRHPGQTVGHLLSILKVTKQSISRVLKDLIEQAYVEQKSGARDREIRSVSHDDSLRKASQLMQQWKLGSLLVTNSQSYVGVITDSALAREVAAKGLDPNTTIVKTCMRTPVVAIEGGRPIIDAVRMMKEQATRHLAVTQDGQIIGVISVSNILRYYSGIA